MMPSIGKNETETSVILHKCSEVKDIKRTQNNLPIYIWMVGHASVRVCPNEKFE
jgi:hypothetical protein